MTAREDREQTADLVEEIIQSWRNRLAKQPREAGSIDGSDVEAQADALAARPPGSANC
jgi:hypothetical protein